MKVFVYITEIDGDNPMVDVYASEELAQERFVTDVLNDERVDDSDKQHIRMTAEPTLRQNLARDAYEARDGDGYGCDSWYGCTEQEVLRHV